MTSKQLKTINYGRYAIIVSEEANKMIQFTVYRLGKDNRPKPPKVASFLYKTVQEGEGLIENEIKNLERTKTEARQGGLPTKEEYKKCIEALLANDEITDNQLKMLIAHAKKPDRKIYAEELAEITGYKDLGGANMHYGDLGHKMCDFLSYKPKEENNNVPVWTFVIASGDYDENNHWYWVMRDELFEALKESNLLN